MTHYKDATMDNLMHMQSEVWLKERDRDWVIDERQRDIFEDIEAENRAGDDGADLYLMRDCRVGRGAE